MFKLFNKFNNKIFYNLVINDFKARYVGSYLGIIWGFIQPLITIGVYWYVFQVGFRANSRSDGTPFIVWLICGIIAWFFFSEALGIASSAFLEYNYLVKKISFKIGILPAVKISSALLIHTFFLVFTMIVTSLYGYHPSLFYIQVLYYLFATIFLLFGLTLITSSLIVFFRDINQIIGIVIQIGFWMIPIVWSSEILSPNMLKLFKLNPIYYIIEGYRDSFITHVAFWDKPYQTIYFWVLSIIILFIGIGIFRKLKPFFADEL